MCCGAVPPFFSSLSASVLNVYAYLNIYLTFTQQGIVTMKKDPSKSELSKGLPPPYSVEAGWLT